MAITRKAGESFVVRVGDVEVVVRIHKLTAKTARVAIDAPDGVEIMRCELETRSGKTDNTTSGAGAPETTAETGGDGGNRTGGKRTPAGV